MKRYLAVCYAKAELAHGEEAVASLELDILNEGWGRTGFGDAVFEVYEGDFENDEAFTWAVRRIRDLLGPSWLEGLEDYEQWKLESGNPGAAPEIQPLHPSHASARTVYAVAGGNHVIVLLPRGSTAGRVDVIEVLAQPGGGPPPHRHAFGEWFRVLSGELTLCEERNGVVVTTSVLKAGETVWVPPWAVHGTLNLSSGPTRFECVSQPGLGTGYFAEAGVRVADEHTPPATEPPGPSELAEIAARWGIEFWTGPVEHSHAAGG